MKKKIYKNLITTGLKELNAKKNDLFLGEWCILSKENIKKDDKLNVCEYHFNQKNKVKIDHIYISKLYKKVLPAITIALNNYHKTEKSKKYWEIIVGPTLVQLLSIFWDRWETISGALKKYKIYQVPIVNYSQKDFITQDFYDLFKDKMNTHFWNNCIYSELIKEKLKIKIFKIKNSKIKKQNKILNYWSKSQELKEFRLNKSNKCQFTLFDENFNKINLSKFILSQKKFFKKNKIFMTKINLSKKIIKRNILINFKTRNSFEKIVVKKIINYFPLSHLEGMKKIRQLTDRVKVKSKYIFTSFGHINNDLFKVWLAEKIESKESKLIIAHHGGIIEKEINFNSWENISNKLISWEKRKKGFKKYIQLPPIFLSYKSRIYKIFSNLTEKNKILFLTSSSDLYTYRLEDKILSSQIKLNLNSWKLFFSKLPANIKNEIVVRNNPEFDPWNLKDDLNFFFKRNVCSNKKSIHEDINRSKILVNTSASTAFFQSMYSNIPTILLLKENLWNLSSDGKKIYNILKKNKIIFTNSNLLAKHLIKINKNPLIWWNSKKTLKARDNFNSQYMKNGNFDDWCNFFNSLN